MMLTGAVVLNVIYLMELLIQDNLSAYFGLLSLNAIGPLLYLGIVASIGGFFLVNTSLSKLPAHVSSVYANLATVVSVIAGVLVLQESISWFHYVGALMIISGVYGTARFRRKVSV
jgi:drug/metabolite transporter (DMT)-like permease